MPREVPVDRGLFDQLVESGSTQMLPAKAWPPHVGLMSDVRQVWAWSNTSTEAAIRVIRSGGLSGKAFKQDEWVFVKQKDGTVTMRGPSKDVDGGHHTDLLPGWPLRDQKSD